MAAIQLMIELSFSCPKCKMKGSQGKLLILLGFLFLVKTTSPQSFSVLPDDPMATEEDKQFILRTYQLARTASENGNRPFAAILVHKSAVLAEFQSSSTTTGDITQHDVTGLISQFSPELDRSIWQESVIYTSTEPCVMCCGAIYWSGVSRVVYGVTARKLESFLPNYRGISSREIFEKINNEIVVVGPVLEAKGLEIHQQYWPNRK